MTKLKAIRRHLRSLRRRRRRVRRATAWSAVLIALLWLLGAIFAVDVGFELDVLQRVLVMLAGAGLTIWAFARFAVPFLGVRETEMQLALHVEKQHHINSDLVAALQFESPEASAWGSPQLEGAVVDQMAQVGGRLNVFQGLSRRQLTHRMFWLLLTAALAGAVVVRFPDHAYTFLNRLLLGARHYPSHTRIEQVVINDRLVLQPTLYQTSPKSLKSPQHHPLAFLVQCSGNLPPQGIAKLRSPNGQLRPLELLRLTLEERKQRLTEAETRIANAIRTREVDLTGTWAREVEMLLQFDAADAARHVAEANSDPTRLTDVALAIKSVLQSWPSQADSTAVYAAHLPSLTDPITYQIYLGDAWTDPATVDMLALPIVEPTLIPVPPPYVRTEKAPAAAANARQLSVLEGSEVKVSVECTNHKQLQAAWLTLVGEPELKRYPLTQQDDAGYRWALTATDSPFANITRELRFEIQVTDVDDLHLEPAIRSHVRLKADRPPTGSIYCVHRVVLPQAKPVLEYYANDDYGIAQVRLDLQLERGPKDSPETKEEVASRSLLVGTQPLLANALPIDRRGRDKQTGKPRGYVLDLASLRSGKNGQEKPVELAKGDRLKLILEVVDYRGQLPGASYRSDPLVLEITDQSGFLADQTEHLQRLESGLQKTENVELDIASGKTSGARAGQRSSGTLRKPGKGGSP
ncbi:MAG: hypothetical protein NTY19_34480 [Planctomycetota bacterium]|nr:hypothetical protein [Planctomycetota bacterium]